MFTSFTLLYTLPYLTLLTYLALLYLITPYLTFWPVLPDHNLPYHTIPYVTERQVAPQFSRRPEDVNVKPGGSVNLTCVAIGSPMPYVKWLHGVMELTPEGSLPPIGINVLRLTNVSHSTTYTCEASSTLGVISAQAEVKLKGTCDSQYVYLSLCL